MNDIQQKISEIEKQDRRSRIAYAIVGFMVALFLVLLLIYINYKKGIAKKIMVKNQKIEVKNNELEQKNFEILEYQKMVEELNDKRLNTIDSLNTITTFKFDSILKELNKYKNNIENTVAIKSIYSVERNSKKIATEIQNARILKYYKQPTLTNGTRSDKPTKKIEEPIYIRMYSYNPDSRIKKEIIKILQQQKHRVKVYPDWSRKPSFFSKKSTILYYSDKTKKRAERLRAVLNKKGYKFNISKGSGLGISKNQVDNTFIIHYMK